MANTGDRYFEKECDRCGNRVLLRVSETRGDVAIDRLNRIEKLIKRQRYGWRRNETLAQVYDIIHGFK